MKQFVKKNVFKAIAIGLVMLVCLIPASAAAGCTNGQTVAVKTVYVNGSQAACGALGAQNKANVTNCPTPNAGANVTTTPAQTPKAEAQVPVTEAPKTEAPKTEAPKTEAPKTETPKTEAPKTETPKTETANSSINDFEREVARLVNEIRVKNGLSELTLNEELSAVARVKAEDMAKNNYFSHNSPTYGSPFDMMKKFGISYRAAGENIAKGQTTPQQVVDAWMNSEGHRANILSASFTQIGMGYTANGHLWSQMFIG